MTLNEKIENINRLLDEFEGKAGLVKQAELGECEILEESMESIRLWSNYDLAEASVELSLYSFKLQRIINRQTAIKGWAQRELDLYLGDKLDSGYGQYWEKKNRAASQDDYARLLHKLISKTTAAIDRLSYLPGRISEISKALEGLRYAKKDQ